jgi:S1-C subfamily serine protease
MVNSALVLWAFATSSVDSPFVPWSILGACSRIQNGRDTSQSGTSTCIAVRDGFAYLLTAAHATPKGDARVYDLFTRNSHPLPSRSLRRGDVIYRSATRDLALVKIAFSGDAIRVVRLATSDDRPHRFPFAAVSVGCPGGLPPRGRTETIIGKSLVRRSDGTAAFFWQTANPPVGGMSGGPLLDRSGRLIGVCVASQDGKGYFAHTDEILVALKEAGLGWIVNSAKPNRN